MHTLWGGVLYYITLSVFLTLCPNRLQIFKGIGYSFISSVL